MPSTTSLAFTKMRSRLWSAHIGKKPLVVLPLEDFDHMREELDMLRSRTLRKTIARARRDVRNGNVLTLAEVKRRLKL